MNKIVILLLSLGMLIVAYFTYTTHVNAIDVYRKENELQKILSSYDYVNLQIRNAFQQSLMYDITRERGNLKDYFESEDRIYKTLSEIEELGASAGLEQIPADSLRPLVARQFLRIEKFRLRDHEGNDSTLMKNLDASLADQMKIEQIIDADKQFVERTGAEENRTGILAPAFILFLFLMGAGSFAYAYQSLTYTRKEIKGIEEKFRRNQGILTTEIEKFKDLEQVQDRLLENTREIIVLLKPETEYLGIGDFRIHKLSREAADIFQFTEEKSFRKLLKNAMSRDEADSLMEQLMDSFESSKTANAEVRLKIEGKEIPVNLQVLPGAGHVIIRG